MSRIGKKPIAIPEGVQVDVSDTNLVTVKGKLGELSQQVDTRLTVKIEEGNIEVHRSSDEKDQRAMHGLYRSLIDGMVKGVSGGYTIQMELVGVGYKAESNGQLLEMSLGFSHNILFELPPEVKVEAKTEKRANPIITLSSHNKQLIGQVAAKIRSLRPPEPYKGKGIKFVGEEIRRKAGKAAAQ